MASSFQPRYLRDTAFPIEAILCENSMCAYPLHNHISMFSIGIVLSGSLRLTLCGNTCTLESGNLFCIPPYCPHQIAPAERYTLFTLCIETQAPAHYGTEALQQRIHTLLQEIFDEETLNHSQWERLADTVKNLPGSTVPPAPLSSDSFLEALRQQLERSPELPLCIDAMAHAALLSKYHFIRRFRQAVGLTPHRFQVQNRVRKAQRLLPQADCLTEAALTAGFFDQSHFIRQFKKEVGLTPSAYQKCCGVFLPSGAISTAREGILQTGTAPPALR